jgi:hypothetical protein
MKNQVMHILGSTLRQMGEVCQLLPPILGHRHPFSSTSIDAASAPCEMVSCAAAAARCPGAGEAARSGRGARSGGGGGSGGAREATHEFRVAWRGAWGG